MRRLFSPVAAGLFLGGAATLIVGLTRAARSTWPSRRGADLLVVAVAVVLLYLSVAAWTWRRSSGRRGPVRRWAAAHLPAETGWALLLGGLPPLLLLMLAVTYLVAPGLVGLAAGRSGAAQVLLIGGFWTALWAAFLAVTAVGLHVVRTSRTKR